MVCVRPQPSLMPSRQERAHFRCQGCDTNQHECVRADARWATTQHPCPGEAAGESTRDSLESIIVRPVLIQATRHRLADVLQSTVGQCEARAQSQTCLFASEPAHKAENQEADIRPPL